MAEVEVLIPRELWLKVRETAKRLGCDPEDLIAEAVRKLYARLEAQVAKGKKPKDVLAELLEPQAA